MSRTTRLLQVDPNAPDPSALAEAAAILRHGGLVAFATETVYGLGADATNPKAVARIFEAKGRPSFNPLIVHADSITMARGCVADWPDQAETLALRFWPGPLTLVLPRSDQIPDIVTAGRKTVGVRVPDSEGRAGGDRARRTSGRRPEREPIDRDLTDPGEPCAPRPRRRDRSDPG